MTKGLFYFILTLMMGSLHAEGWILRTALGYSFPLADNHRIWTPGGFSNMNSQEYMFGSGWGIGINEGYTWWRKADESDFNKSRSTLHRLPLLLTCILPLTRSGLFEGTSNQLYCIIGGGTEFRILRWTVDWGYDTYIDTDMDFYPAAITGLRFEYRGSGGGYFVSANLTYVFSNRRHGFHDLSAELRGGMMWFLE